MVLYCKKELVGVMLDRFGTEASVRPEGKEEIALRTEVEVSPQFFGWPGGARRQSAHSGACDVAESYGNICGGSCPAMRMCKMFFTFFCECDTFLP